MHLLLVQIIAVTRNLFNFFVIEIVLSNIQDKIVENVYNHPSSTVEVPFSMQYLQLFGKVNTRIIREKKLMSIQEYVQLHLSDTLMFNSKFKKKYHFMSFLQKILIALFLQNLM